MTLIDPNPYIMLRRFLDLQQALAAKTVLDASGIESYLADENAIRMMISNLGGVRFFVRQSDAEAVATLLNERSPGKS